MGELGPVGHLNGLDLFTPAVDPEQPLDEVHHKDQIKELIIIVIIIR